MKTLINPTAWITAFVLLCVLFILTACEKERPLQVGATVKVILPNGHGSGVYLGDGFILTAGHVGKGASTVKVKMDDNSIAEGAVLWASYAAGIPDVSLIYVEPKQMARAAVATLSCEKPHLGQYVRIVGSPRDVEFITTWGRIGRADAPSSGSHFRYVIAMDATATNGVSGGPVFDEDTGKLIGLLVAGYPGTGYSFMTPGAEICRYMARAV